MTLDPASLRALAASRFHIDAPRVPGRGDHDLNPDMDVPAATEIPAAVLVPIVARAEGLTVLLTQRTTDLPSHAGQVAFPGGKVDPDDAGALAAALRETEEEIGLDRRFVEPLGFLDLYRTGSGFAIAPAVALVAEGFELRLNPREVADAFEVPLAFLLDAANHQQRSGEWRGRMRYYYAMPYRERHIWGATAGIIRNLYERLGG